MKKSLFLILASISVCFGFTLSKDILHSKQIQVVYMNYSDLGNYKTSDYFSNDQCKYSYENLTCIIDFNKKHSKTILHKTNETSIIPFTETIPEPPTSILSIPVFDITKTNRTKNICNIECKQIIAKYENDRYEIWYFQPKKIKKSRINQHTGYQQIPGIIMEVSKNNKLERQAIEIKNQIEE